MAAPKELGLDPFPDPVGNFGAPWQPFWILQSVLVFSIHLYSSLLISARLNGGVALKVLKFYSPGIYPQNSSNSVPRDPRRVAMPFLVLSVLG